MSADVLSIQAPKHAWPACNFRFSGLPFGIPSLSPKMRSLQSPSRLRLGFEIFKQIQRDRPRSEVIGRVFGLAFLTIS